MPQCKRCNAVALASAWRRYERNGRLKALCPACDDREQEHRALVSDAKARGYANVGHTPEYKLEQRRREAEQAGREFRTLAERRLSKIEREADRLRSRFIRQWIRELAPSGNLYESDPVFREEKKASSRGYYRRHESKERGRVAEYKTLNPGLKRSWDRTRLLRESLQGDGSATKAAIARRKAEATKCCYCERPFESESEKQTDHVVPLAMGGMHSLSNIVIACARCNGMKARLMPEEWDVRRSVMHNTRVPLGDFPGRAKALRDFT